jgi:hypothetical protein
MARRATGLIFYLADVLRHRLLSPALHIECNDQTGNDQSLQNRPLHDALLLVSHVKQRPMKFDGASFASGLNGESHPVGIAVLVAGAT